MLTNHQIPIGKLDAYCCSFSNLRLDANLVAQFFRNFLDEGKTKAR